MNINSLKEKPWYRQGAATYPWFIFIPYTGHSIVFGSDNSFVYQNGYINYGYFNKDAELKIALSLLKKQKTNKKFLTNLIKKWRKRAEQQLNFMKKTNLNAADHELIKSIKKIYKLMVDAWVFGILIEAFDPWGDKIISEELERHNIKLTHNELKTFLSSTEYGYAQKEKIDFLAAVKNRKLKKHIKRYFWLNNSWEKVRVLDEDYFKNRYIKKIRKEVFGIKRKIKGIKRKKAEICKKKKIPSELRNIFDFFIKLVDWRDERKRYVLMSNHYLYELAKEISRRTGININLLLFAIPSEIKTLRLPKSYVRELQKRTKGIIYYYKNKPVILTGKEAKKLHNIFEWALRKNFVEIKGNIANKGRIRGIVRIIHTEKDFSKMKKGDIIVAIMTRPEFTPILHKAAAIVTDEGSITCHAAVISREMNIPCIVGTQLATNVLKDGQLVEVNANDGVVKIIK